ncbi:hypothetical protein PILCRDRAFT_611109 [Piloderma croceum F 1598]|uniref:Uncharacterized protein n=1 Tax=Piloderma croceum (strain F 1598) TaxID=765440 RepID=A0A0C3BKI9_PILCF|nr:hypothetical protein PILCRDRAFT_611109 [Piloderma croceum F 1598]
MPKAPKGKKRQTLRDFNEIMGLPAENDQEASEHIRMYLWKVIENHFDWNKTANHQSTAAWKDVDSEILKNMPHIYSTPERRRATQLYINRYFSNAGHTFRKERAMHGNRDVNEDVSGDETVVETPSLLPKDNPNASINTSQGPPSRDVIHRDASETSGPATSAQPSCASYIAPLSSFEPEGISIRIVIDKTVDIKHASLALQIAQECEATLTSLGTRPNAQ